MRQAWPDSLLEALAPTRKALVTARPVSGSSSERISPAASAGGADRTRAALELLEEDIRGQAQQDAELVGQKSRAAGPVHLQPVMQLLEPVLHVAPLAVDLLVDGLGRAGQVGHEEPGIVLGVAT